LGERFLTNLIERQKVLSEMPFDDPLVDIDMKDIVDIVRVYSLFSKYQDKDASLFVP
jgi:hypothetical protein